MSASSSIELPYVKGDLARPTVPILAFGGGLTLTVVLRILGHLNLPLYAICEKADYAPHSRWYREPPLKGAANLAPRELSIFLQALPLEQAVLMPCSDDWLQAVASLPASLSRRFPSCTSPAHVVQAMVDKARFAILLETLGIPHPRTRLVRSSEELAGIPKEEFDNGILKPISSVEFARKHGVKGYLVRTRAQALQAAGRIDFPILLQEYIPGPPTVSYFIDGFVDCNGRVCARFARQRLRMYPAKLGNSSFMVSVPLDEVAGSAAALDCLLKSVPYRGVFSAEFKYDGRDRTFKLLEVNARPWWYVGFAARCGVDVCTLAYRDALGLQVQPVLKYEVGRHCVFLLDDFGAYRQLHREGGLSFSSWIRSWAGADDALLCWDDPGPGLACLAYLLRDRVCGRRSRYAEFD